MRTTLTLDDDVAAALERRRAARGTRLREEVNDLLRAGLAAAEHGLKDEDDFVLPAYDPGRQLITDFRALDEIVDDEDIDRATMARS